MNGKIEIPFSNSKFVRGFRNGQEGIIRLIKNSKKKVIVINAPCGSGKSLIAMCAGHGKNYPEQTIYNCSSIGLQKQLHEDFKEARVLMGRSNYPCDLYEGDKASDCKGKCSEMLNGLISCTYDKEKKKAIASQYVILNSHYYLNEVNYVGRFSKRKTVIIDEADLIEKMLTSFISLNIDYDLISKYRLGIPDYVTKLDSWKYWADSAIKSLTNVLVKTSANDPEEETENINKLKDKLNLLKRDIDNTWIFEHTKKFEFRPVWLNKNLTNTYLFNHASQFILMSATMLPKAIISKLLGLEISEIDYIEAPSYFPIANRQVIYNPIKRLKYGENEQDIYREVERIIKIHKYQKGIIHSVSYDRMNKIAAIDPKRMITHNSFNKPEQLQKFYNSSNGIFVSPSSECGLDLVGDLGRFAIWPKIPFPSLGDKVISKRAYSKPFGNYWYKAITAQLVVQGCGRIVRNELDHGTNYILDAAFSDIVEYTPKYFRDAIVCKF